MAQGSFDEIAPELFPSSRQLHDSDVIGFRAPVVCELVGVTYRQLDYWARTELVQPTARSAGGSGTSRLYSFKDILVLRVVKRLLDAGMSLQSIRTAVAHLCSLGVDDLAGTTLVSDGTTIYECRSPDEIVDILHGGQGVFAIALDRAVTDVTALLAAAPSELAVTAGPTRDEVSARRALKPGA